MFFAMIAASALSWIAAEILKTNLAQSIVMGFLIGTVCGLLCSISEDL
jgi:hypothetical protein